MSAKSTATATTTRSPLRLRALAVLATVVAGALIWLVAHSVLDIDLRVPDGPGSTTTTALALPAVLIGTAVVSLLGWGLLALLEKFAAARSRTVWTVAAVLVLVVSLFAPLFGAGLSGGNRATLVLLHLTVGAILVPAFRRSSAPA
ncbi:DUF6069 family protein [Streptomyces turgidiscabies]|uniref:Uncharacterized protein n=1 Tax=Streptomyces turgidiscabies (strain Car8) TaxID=698760 RepID=L7FDS7_STRT8|nr:MULTISPECIES: DUF6069 family protein [Streptomyces]ELP69452.1 hypothetical protein STRTUCAR8_03237 [Streptomyces turgidiscabies Car8]MDX3494390.1 DUF6069 family protein [Streptomyces turgidiscabies]GAQ74669.1 hypothetical protein T45_06449 [Streptomyces turgidiscabies]